MALAGATGGLTPPCWPRMTPPLVVRNQASTDMGVLLVTPLAGYGMKLTGRDTNWFVPLRLNASPTSPEANVAPFCSAPLFDPIESFAFPSAVYQSTIPEGSGAQAAGGGTLHLPDLPALTIAWISA